MQLNLMHHGLVQFLAQDPEREELAGDQMYVDLDLSHDNLPAWSELHIGGPDGAVIVVTEAAAQRLREVHRALRQGGDGLRQRAGGQAAAAARAVRQGGAARARSDRATRWSSYALRAAGGVTVPTPAPAERSWEHASMTDTAAREFSTVGVIGLGTMGAGIAEVFARNGYTVIGVELNDGGRRARSPAPRALHGPRGEAREDDRGAAGRAARPDHPHDRHDGALRGRPRRRGRGRVAERSRSRSSRKLDGIVRDDAILATNTSSLSVTEISTANSKPGRVIGVHFFNPAPVQNLVEIIRTVVTEPAVLEHVQGVLRDLGKNPVVCGDKAGFIANTLLFGYLNHAVSMYEGKYASREDIDAAMRFGCGYPMGPLALLDLIGLDTAYEILDTMYKQGRDRLHAPAPILKQYVTAGLLGRKSGRGFYTYEAPDSPGRRGRRPDAERGRQAAAAPRHPARRGRRHRHDGRGHRRGLRQGGLRRALHRPRPGQGRRGRRDDHQELRQADPARPGHRGAEGRGARSRARHHLARRPPRRRPRRRGDRRGPRDQDHALREPRRDLQAGRASSRPRRRRCRSSRWPR